MYTDCPPQGVLALDVWRGLMTGCKFDSVRTWYEFAFILIVEVAILPLPTYHAKDARVTYFSC